MQKYLLLTLGLICAYGVSANQPGNELSLEMAISIQNGCLKYAKDNNLKLAIAVYDVHGNIKSFIRMDGTSVGTSEVARWKAKSAANYQFSTQETKAWNVPTAPNIATSAGGIPIKNKRGLVIGAIGVSGAQSSVDVSCAEAGLAAGKELKQ